MGGLAVRHWTRGAELVPAAGMLPGCLKLWGVGGECLLGAEITPHPFPVTSFSLNCPSIFITLGAAQDKLVEMGPCRFGWVLGVTQLLQVVIKMSKRLGQGWGPQDGHRLNSPRGRDCPEGHGKAREVTEL